MAKHEISNSDDVIDSRDVIARLEELQSERETLSDALDEATAAHNADTNADTERAMIDARKALQDWDESDDATELKALETLTEEAEGYAPDWTHGATLIRDSYFVDYCEELVKDIGDLPKDLPGYLVIDWEKTADNLQADYTSVEYDGVTYWVR